MKRLAAVLCLLLGLAIALPAQTVSTQYQHIGYTWTPGSLIACSVSASSPTSCVKDYVLTLTDPTGKSLTPIPIAYSASSYQFGPGGFLYCGNWPASLAIEYFDDKGAAQVTAGNTTTTTVSCPFVVSPPSGLKGTPGP